MVEDRVLAVEKEHNANYKQFEMLERFWSILSVWVSVVFSSSIFPKTNIAPENRPPQ